MQKYWKRNAELFQFVAQIEFDIKKTLYSNKQFARWLSLITRDVITKLKTFKTKLELDRIIINITNHEITTFKIIQLFSRHIDKKQLRYVIYEGDVE